MRFFDFGERAAFAPSGTTQLAEVEQELPPPPEPIFDSWNPTPEPAAPDYGGYESIDDLVSSLQTPDYTESQNYWEEPAPAPPPVWNDWQYSTDPPAEWDTSGGFAPPVFGDDGDNPSWGTSFEDTTMPFSSRIDNYVDANYTTDPWADVIDLRNQAPVEDADTFEGQPLYGYDSGLPSDPSAFQSDMFPYGYEPPSDPYSGYASVEDMVAALQTPDYTGDQRFTPENGRSMGGSFWGPNDGAMDSGWIDPAPGMEDAVPRLFFDKNIDYGDTEIPAPGQGMMDIMLGAGRAAETRRQGREPQYGFGDLAGDVLHGANVLSTAPKEVATDLFPMAVDTWTGELIPDLMRRGLDQVGLDNRYTDAMINASDYAQFLNPVTGAGKLAGMIAERKGVYEPGSGYDDAGRIFTTAAESDNPWDYAERLTKQNEERPWQQQLLGEVINPTNLLGMGLYEKSATAPLWLQRLDKAADIAQGGPLLGAATKAFGAGRYADNMLNALAKEDSLIGRILRDESGQVAAKAGGRFALPAAGGAAVGVSEDGWNPAEWDEDTLKKALIVAGITGGVTNADELSRAYGKLPFLKERGFGVDKYWESPLAVDGIVPVPDVAAVAKDNPMPALARARNAARNLMNRLPGDRMQRFMDSEEMYPYATAYRDLTDRGAKVAREMEGKVLGIRQAAGININPETGEMLTEDGRPLLDAFTGTSPYKSPPGQAYYDIEKQAWEAFLTPAVSLPEVALNLPLYRDVLQVITPEQADAIARIADEFKPYEEQLTRMGLLKAEDRPIGWIEGTSLYIPSQAVPRGQESIPVNYRQFTPQQGGTPGSLKEQRFKTFDEQLKAGFVDLTPEKAAGIYVRQSTANIGAVALGDQMLDNLTINGVKMRDALPPDDVVAMRKIANDYKTELQAKLRETSRNLGEITRYLPSSKRWSDRVQAHFDVLKEKAMAGVGDPNDKRDAAIIAKEALSGAMELGRDLLDSTKVMIDETGSLRQQLGKVMAETEALRAAPPVTAKEIEGRVVAEEYAQQQLRETKRAAELLLPQEMSIPDAEKVLEQAKRIRFAVEQLADDYDAQLLAQGATKEGLSAELRSVKDALKETHRAFNSDIADVSAYSKIIGGLQALAKNAGQVKAIDERAAKADELLKLRDDLKEQLDVVRQYDKGWEAIEHRASELNKRMVGAEGNVSAAQMGERLNLSGPAGQVYLPKDLANSFNKYFATKAVNETLSTAGLVDVFNDSFRMLGAGLDLAGRLTTGLATLAKNPASAVRSTITATRSMGDNKAYFEALDKFRAAHPDWPPEKLIQLGLEASPHGMTLEGPESFAGMVDKVPVFKQAGRHFSVSGDLDRFENAYRAIELYKPKADDVDLVSRIIAGANQIGGRTATTFGEQVVGRDVASRLWFAGRFTQSQFELMLNAALAKGPEGDMARTAIARMAGTIGGLHIAANAALGNDLDPFEVEIGDRRYSLFGPWKSTGKMLMNTGSSAADAATSAAQGNWDGTREGLVNILLGDNGVKDYITGKLGPTASALTSLVGLKDAYSDGVGPIPGRFWDAAPIPFAAKGFIEEAVNDIDWNDMNSVGQALFGLPLNLLGANNSFISPFSQMKKDAQSWFEKQPDSMGDDVMEDPIALAKWKAENPGKVPEPRGKDAKRRAEVNAEAAARYAANDEKFQSDPTYTVGAWLAEMKDIKSDRQVKLPAYTGDDKAAKEGSGQALIDSYFDMFDTARAADGTWDEDAFGAAFQSWKEKNGDNGLAYVREFLKLNQTPIMQMYATDMETLSDAGYFDVKRYNSTVLSNDEAARIKNEALNAKKRGEYNLSPDVPEDTAIRVYMIKKYGYKSGSDEIWDVQHYGEQSNQTKKYQALKKQYAAETSWFDDSLEWATIEKLHQR